MKRFERSQRVSEEIRKIVAEVMQREIKDYDLTSLTVTRCEANRDISEATVYYSVLGDDDKRSEMAEALTRIGGFLQKRVGDELHLRQVPHLRFSYDKSVAESLRMDELFDQLNREQDGNDQS